MVWGVWCGVCGVGCVGGVVWCGVGGVVWVVWVCMEGEGGGVGLCVGGGRGGRRGPLGHGVQAGGLPTGTPK